MSLDTIIIDIMTGLQTLNRSLANVQAPAPSLYPTVIDTTNGQVVALTFPGDGEAWQKGAGYSQGTRTFRVIVFLDPVAQGDIPSHVVDGAQILQKFVNLFVLSTNTPLINPGAYQATIESGPTGPHITDTGPGPSLRFGGRDWYGFELSIPVRWQGPQI